MLGELGALTKQNIGAGDKAKVRAGAKPGGATADMEVEHVLAEWRDYYVNVSQVLNTGAELAVKPEEVRKAIVITEAAVKSAKTGKSVKIAG